MSFSGNKDDVKNLLRKLQTAPDRGQKLSFSYSKKQDCTVSTNVDGIRVIRDAMTSCNGGSSQKLRQMQASVPPPLVNLNPQAEDGDY